MIIATRQTAHSDEHFIGMFTDMTHALTYIRGAYNITETEVIDKVYTSSGDGYGFVPYTASRTVLDGMTFWLYRTEEKKQQLPPMEPTDEELAYWKDCLHEAQYQGLV